MDAPQHIDGDRVYLLAITAEVATSLLGGALPGHLTFATGYPGEASIEVMDLLAGARKHEPTAFTPYFIVRREDDAIIGDIGFSLPDGPDSPTVGYDVIEPLWGQGYATEAFRALIRALFTLPQVTSVRADTLKDHWANRRVMEKAGLTLVREGTDNVDGEMQELVYYEIARP